MEIDSVKLVYFSPTETTKAVAHGIAHGIDSTSIELVDLTTPSGREQSLLAAKDELLVVAVPVYMGRVPALATEWLKTIKADNTPAVCVVVYGNRAYDDALLELKDTVEKCGCIPIACGAYIGEHSFSNSDTPIAEGRPDKADVTHAEEFGRKICEKLQAVSSLSQLSDVAVPGSYPYGGRTELWSVDFIAVNSTCTQCGSCADVCPVGAIDSQHSSIINHEKCITCCACIKSCPQGARTMKPSPVKDASERLNNLCKEPKQPECFL
ncbi:EFR1 family ferrodoxin [Halodesulfovibrio aestuarii]|uniref:EFR1 family ferrodoxin n=1 Tax=Halodesulfovibrio aestuarii TaxID=126333 RepID=UPI00351FD2BB